MIRTLAEWLRNAADRIAPAGEEPLTWLVLAASLGVAVWSSRARAWTVRRLLAHATLTLWLVATLAITIYPVEVDFDPTPWHRAKVSSIIPFADTVDAFRNTADRVMSPEEYEEAVKRLAEELGIPPEEVELDPVVRGTPISVFLKDTLGNILLFVPLGLLARGALRLDKWRSVALTALVLSGLIELSQLFFELGSLASVDDTIYNTTGALLGYLAIRSLPVRVSQTV